MQIKGSVYSVHTLLFQTVQYYHHLIFILYAKQKYNLIDVIHYCWHKQTMHVNKIIIYVYKDVAICAVPHHYDV